MTSQQPAARVEEARAALALRRLIDETRTLFHRLKHVAEVVHRADRVSAGERGVLMELAQLGPRTVPVMARARPVSRQHIQTIVNALLKRKLVELTENPRHRRSRLVRLTATGREITGRIRAREGQVLTGLSQTLDPADLIGASETLAAVGRLVLKHGLESNDGAKGERHGDAR